VACLPRESCNIIFMLRWGPSYILLISGFLSLPLDEGTVSGKTTCPRPSRRKCGVACSSRCSQADTNPKECRKSRTGATAIATGAPPGCVCRRLRAVLCTFCSLDPVFLVRGSSAAPKHSTVLGESSRSYEERSTQHAVIILAMDPSYGDCSNIIPNALESTPPGRQQSSLSRIREAVSRQVGDCVPDTNFLTTQGRDRCDVINSDLTQSETQHKCEGAQLIDEKNEREEPTQCQRKTEGGGLRKGHERKE